MTDKYKPVPRVRMTLTLAIQNRVLLQLSQAFGIMESWDRKHEITCCASDFAYFMSLVSKMENPPTMKQLGVEYIDIRKDVLRTSVPQRSQKWNGVEAEPEEQEIDTKVSATYKTRQLLVAAEATDEVLVDGDGWWNDDGNIYTVPIDFPNWGARIEVHGRSIDEARALAFRVLDGLT